MVKMYWLFYKSLLVINIAFSVCFSLVVTFYLSAQAENVGLMPTMLRLAVYFYLTGGLMLGLGYHEFYKKKRYSFYNNHALTKVHLFLSAIFINSVIGVPLLILVSYA